MGSLRRRKIDGRTLRGQPPYRLPTKLTIEDVAWIKSVMLLDRRHRQRSGLQTHTVGLRARLAEKFGISHWTVEAIRRGRRWRRVQAHRWDERQLTGR